MQQAFEYRFYRPDDEDQFQELFASTFGSDRSIDEIRWRYERAPQGPGVIQIVERAGEVVASYAHVTFEAFLDSQRLSLGQTADLMVRSDLRGQGLMKRLVERRVEFADYDLHISFPSPQSARLSTRYGVGESIGNMTTWVRRGDLSQFRKLERLKTIPAAGKVLAHGVDIYAGRPKRGLLVTEETPRGSELDDLAQRSARFARLIRVRDAAYVEWRWLANPCGDWTILSARDREGNLHGWAVFGIDPGRRPFIAPGGYVVDILCDGPAATRMLLVDASRRMLRAGCLVVYFDYADPRPWAQRACLRAGFMARKPGPIVFVGRTARADRPEAQRLENWYLTRGDTDFA